MLSAPLLLAIETATRRLSVALLRGEELLAEQVGDHGAAESLLPGIDALLSQAGLGVEEIGAFAVSVGPGSFTGLRVGIATVKGLAFASPRPVAPVPTLAALARSAGEGEEPVVALLDARRGELYAGAWIRGGEEPHPSVPEGLYAPDELAERLPERGALAGEGIALLEARGLGGDLRRVPPPRGVPAARHVGVLGARLLARGGGIRAEDLVPCYGRPAAAEARRSGLR